MSNVTIICCTHSERGSCSAAVLAQLLERLSPAVIFVESQPAQLASPHSLEGRAIAAYTGQNRCDIVPVDSVDVATRLHGAMERVFDYVEQVSDEYRALLSLRDRESYLYGFEYLNSRAFRRLNARMVEIEDVIVSQSSDEQMRTGLRDWRLLHQSREERMVETAVAYAQAHVFDRGVFLVGAAHEAGILREAKRIDAKNTNPITWVSLAQIAED